MRTAPSIGPEADHREAERVLRAAGWTTGGAGDWAVALRSPDGSVAARINPFDPTGPYTAALYREAAQTRQVPQLYAHHRLSGGGDLQLEIPLASSGPWPESDPRRCGQGWPRPTRPLGESAW